MVKNTRGGSHKHAARKIIHHNTRDYNINSHWACVFHILGNSRLSVVSVNGLELQVVIRNKFKGKRKGNNLISVGSFISIGLYEWENPPKGGDVVEVYTSEDIQRLLQNNAFSEFYNKMNRTLQIFNSNSTTTDNTIHSSLDLQFTNEVIISNNIVVDNPMDLPDPTRVEEVDQVVEEVDIDCI